ncbi:unnamed protein product, partial [Polarella glacialis]
AMAAMRPGGSRRSSDTKRSSADRDSRMASTARTTASTSMGEERTLSSTARGDSPMARRPFERLLDRRLQSVSTFISSTASFGSQTAREPRHKSQNLSQSQWSADMPQAILFPANKPSSRADAKVLDQWVSTSFANYAQRSFVASKDANSEEDLTRAVEELVPILSIGLNEIVRQVSQHCLERGLVLEKIWRTYVELFERALADARATLKRQKERTSKLEAELVRIQNELEELK